MSILLILSGLFSLALGITHVFMPSLFDFDRAIPHEGPSLKPFRLFFFRYDTKRSDVRGIAWVMNHCVSFVLISIGIADLTVVQHLDGPARAGLLIWISAWWFLRAGTQFYLGKRRGDWIVFAWFCLLGILHAWAAA